MLDAKTLEKLFKVSRKKVSGDSFRIFYQVLGEDHLLSDSHWAIRLPERLIPAEYRLKGPGKYSDGEKVSDTPPEIENLIPPPDTLKRIKPHKINDYVMLAESTVREAMGRLSKPKILSIFAEESPESEVLTFFERDLILAFSALYPGANWYRRSKFLKDPCLLRFDHEEPDAPWEAILMPIFKKPSGTVDVRAEDDPE